MTAKEILATLKKLGKAQTAAIYRRHGADANVFGTLTSEIGKLQKKIKVDHPLALELWKSGNGEARILALQIADPALVTAADAERFVADGPARFLGGYLSGLVACSPVAIKMMRAWMKSKDDSEREIGYQIFSDLVKDEDGPIRDADATKVLGTIEKEIHRSPNWSRRAMNGSLISLGIYRTALRKDVLAAARRIGTVEVDHGETGCKTPEAIAYIEKALQRKR
ncbi:MAG: DNA alkylation repair protein [Gemmatimonadales bacterium]